MTQFQRTPRSGVEWPTIALAVLIYAGWLATTYLHRFIPAPLLAMAGGWLIAWHGSLQHETIHGHPTRWRRLNAAIAWPPLNLWLPYERYRSSHLAHHATEHLTVPHMDPEARYLAPGTGRLAAARLILEQAQATLLGRLVMGPIIEAAGFLVREAATVLAGDRRTLGIWTAHIATVALVVAWLMFVCGMSLGEYLLMFVYPGGALSLLRSFAEHRADPIPARRIAVVEGAPILGLLFLNNNLHALHHREPGAPWYRLPELYRRRRAELLVGGPVYAGYREVVARYLFRAHDAIEHPHPWPGPATGRLALETAE